MTIYPLDNNKYKIDFPFSLGKILGMMAREDVKEWLLGEGVTVKDVEKFIESSHVIVNAFYGHRWEKKKEIKWKKKSKKVQE